MTQAQRTLLLGALKSAVGAAAGVVTGMPAIDSEHFNVSSWQGIVRIFGATLWIVIVAEARFWQQWANSSDAPTPGAPANGNH